MFSQRLYNLIESFAKIWEWFGAIALHFNKASLSFHHMPEKEWIVRLNFHLFILLDTAALFVVISNYQNPDVSSFYLTFAFLLASLQITVVYSLFLWFSHDLCIFCNGVLNFMRYLHRKFYSKQKNWPFQL